MIDIYLLGPDGKKEGSLTHLNNKEMVWVDCCMPLKKELKEISMMTGILEDDLLECIDSHERPRINEYDNYSLIVFRAPYITKKKISTTPIAIFISKIKNSVLTIRLKDHEAVDRIKTKISNNTLKINQNELGYLIYRIIDESFNEYFTILDKISSTIEKIEAKVLKNPSKELMLEIMKTKRALIYFSKDLTGNREVISGIEKEYVLHIEKKMIKKFLNIYNDVVQLIDMVNTHRDILTSTMEIYLSSMSNNMNHIMKTLTIISAFVLIPTLISGIYGMNFANSPFNMPELSWQYGYFFAIGLMIVSTIIFYIWFRKKDWL